MKKMVFLILAGLLVLSLPGCGKKQEVSEEALEETKDTSPNEEDSENEEAKEESEENQVEKIPVGEAAFTNNNYLLFVTEDGKSYICKPGDSKANEFYTDADSIIDRGEMSSQYVFAGDYIFNKKDNTKLYNYLTGEETYTFPGETKAKLLQNIRTGEYTGVLFFSFEEGFDGSKGFIGVMNNDGTWRQEMTSDCFVNENQNGYELFDSFNDSAIFTEDSGYILWESNRTKGVSVIIYDSNSNKAFNIESNLNAGCPNPKQIWWYKDGYITWGNTFFHYRRSEETEIGKYNLNDGSREDMSLNDIHSVDGHYGTMFRFKDNSIFCVYSEQTSGDGNMWLQIFDYDFKHISEKYDLTEYHNGVELYILFVDEKRIIFSTNKNGKDYYVVLDLTQNAEREAEPFETRKWGEYSLATEEAVLFYNGINHSFEITLIYDIKNKEWKEFNYEDYPFDGVVYINRATKQMTVTSDGEYFVVNMDDLNSLISPFDL